MNKKNFEAIFVVFIEERQHTINKIEVDQVVGEGIYERRMNVNKNEHTSTQRRSRCGATSSSAPFRPARFL